RLAGRFNRAVARVSASQRPSSRPSSAAAQPARVSSHVPPRPAFACPPGAPLYTGVSRFDVGGSRRDGRVAEGARLESVYTGNRIVGSNPTLSARNPFRDVSHCLTNHQKSSKPGFFGFTRFPTLPIVL